jgi:hypothetical protein
MFGKKISELRFIPVIIPLVAVLAVAGYLVLAYTSGLAGFPLDDAWIHQTYARNLAETGQLAYLPGQPSAGSTSPAWSYLLSVGYLLGIDPQLWAYLLGSLSLAAGAWFAYRLFLRLASNKGIAALLTGLLCALEWHLVWAAASGMETMLFTALSLALLEYLFFHIETREGADGPSSLRTERTIVSAVGIGLLGGVLVLTRPEGLGLMLVVLPAMLELPRPPRRGQLRTRLLAVGIALIGCGLLLTPYLMFNLENSGSLFPNTLYAKQAEYQADAFYLVRLWQVLSPTLVGAQALLVPGFLYAALRLIRRREWLRLLPLIWWMGFLAVYAWRLPVSYQHGRYSIPTIPLLLVYGAWGTSLLLRPRSPRLLVRVISQATPVAVSLLALLFWLRGAQAYRVDVGVIEGEMVAVARWLEANTAPDTLIAVHDIGAVGYWTDRPLLDLAGLITPEVIPFIADAERLAEWMIDQGADYAVFSPDFSPTYVELAADPRFEPVFCTGYAWTRDAGHENMCVYQLTAGH